MRDLFDILVRELRKSRSIKLESAIAKLGLQSRILDLNVLGDHPKPATHDHLKTGHLQTPGH
jgi:hypothetical protein